MQIKGITLACGIAASMFVFAGFALAQNGTWSAKAAMPTARMGLATAVINAKVYAISGCCSTFDSPFTRLKQNEVYDPQTGSWTGNTEAPIPIGVYGAAVGVIGGKLYVAGGQASPSEGTNIKLVQVYDPLGKTWEQPRAMEHAVQGAGSVVLNGRLYAFGGMNDSNTSPVSDARVYDPVANTWTSLKPMSTARVGVTATAINGKIYVVGGSNFVDFNLVDVYDPATDTWTSGAPIPEGRSSHAAAEMDGILYVIAGQQGGVHVNSVLAYNPATNVWTEIEPMPTARALPGIAVVAGHIYVAGGQIAPDANGAARVTNVLESFSPIVPVSIDIKPGSSPNNINLGSAGVVPVAILSSATFDATQIDPESITLAGAPVRLIGRGSKYSCTLQDVNRDGRADLLCHIETAQFMLMAGDSTAVLLAQTFSGQKIRGEDAIQIVP